MLVQGKQKCANCKEHEGTEKWVGQGGVLDFAHGFYKMWCKCCALKAQLKYAKERAKRIPKLEKKLKKIVCK